MPIELIIHADDYGLTGSVSRGILAAHAHGVVTSTSILMTHVTPKELAWAKAEPTLDFGLHLNLTSGAPVSSLSVVPSLIGPRRSFAIPRLESDDPHKRFDFSAVPTDELRNELTAQVEAGLAAPVLISHLDTHHHIHRDRRIFDIVVELAAAHGLAVRALDDEQRKTLERAGIATTAAFLGGWFGGAAITAEALLDGISALPSTATAELMCHPGEPSEDLSIFSSYADERGQELSVLTDPAVRKALKERGVRLIGWADLHYS